MTNIVTDVWRESPKSPPDFVVVAVRRETLRGLLKAGDFFARVSREGANLSDTIDELLVSFAIARKEALGDAGHA